MNELTDLEEKIAHAQDLVERYLMSSKEFYEYTVELFAARAAGRRLPDPTVKR